MEVTKKLLKEYRDLQIEQADLKKRIEMLDKQLQKIIDEGVVVDKVKGGDGGIQTFKIEGFPDAEYSRKRTRLLARKLRYERNLARIDEICDAVQDFIDSIEDSFDRTLFRYYYEDGFSQEEIAEKMYCTQSMISKKLSKIAKME